MALELQILGVAYGLGMFYFLYASGVDMNLLRVTFTYGLLLG